MNYYAVRKRVSQQNLAVYLSSIVTDIFKVSIPYNQRQHNYLPSFLTLSQKIAGTAVALIRFFRKSLCPSFLRHQRNISPFFITDTILYRFIRKDVRSLVRRGTHNFVSVFAHLQNEPILRLRFDYTFFTPPHTKINAVSMSAKFALRCRRCFFHLTMSAPIYDSLSSKKACRDWQTFFFARWLVSATLPSFRR